jgi:hypothetical protein
MHVKAVGAIGHAPFLRSSLLAATQPFQFRPAAHKLIVESAGFVE